MQMSLTKSILNEYLLDSLSRRRIYEWEYDSCWGFMGMVIKGLAALVFGGNLQVANLMIKEGANNWNYGLINTCEGGTYTTCKFNERKRN